MTIPDEKKEKEKFTVVESESPQDDIFWIQYGKESVKDTTGILDERAKYLITTCASLIVVHFGLLLAFEVHGVAFKVTPEFFLVVAAAFFSLSLYPVSRPIKLQSPDIIQNAYKSWIKWKLVWHRLGFGLFIGGLMAMAITLLVPPSSVDQQNISISSPNIIVLTNESVPMIDNISTKLLADPINK